jgi:hypothetical protein
MAKTKQQIQEEANRKFGKGASDEKFKWRQEQQKAAGLDVEKKTRGGVAGTYDRNKALIQAAAPVLAGMFMPGIGSGLAGALTGGLARGLDREGKGGIGLDLGQAARGAASGAALGSLGGAAKSGIQGLLSGGGQAGLKPMPTPGAAVETVGQRTAGAIAPPMPGSVPAPTAMAGAGAAGAGAGQAAGQMASQAAGAAARAPMPPMGAGTTGMAARAPGAISPPPMGGGMPAPTPVPPPQPGRMASMLGGAGEAIKGAGSGILDFAKKNPALVQGVAGGVADVIGSSMQAAPANRRVEMEEEELRRRQAEANRLAAMFMPRG